ncbi:uncharacterized protein [Apostichopus japonicus]|uniref:uncharacterized protein isoform X1 n=1 Tax=Stichopus japonicus TaxID=307972 RepID=UPI003AB2C7A8
MLWGLTIDPVKPLKYIVQQDVYVSFAIVDCREGGHPKQLLHLAVQHGDVEHLLCSFIIGYVFHQNLNLKLTAGEEVTFVITGPNKVHLNGYTCASEAEPIANASSELQDGTRQRVSANGDSLDHQPFMEQEKPEDDYEKEDEEEKEDDHCDDHGGKEASGVTKSDMELLDATKQLEDSLEASQGRRKNQETDTGLLDQGHEVNMETAFTSVLANKQTSRPWETKENQSKKYGLQQENGKEQKIAAASADSIAIQMTADDQNILQDWEEPVKTDSSAGNSSIPEIIILSTDEDESDEKQTIRRSEMRSPKKEDNFSQSRYRKKKRKKRSRSSDKSDGKEKRRPSWEKHRDRKFRHKDSRVMKLETYNSDTEPEVTILSDIIYPAVRSRSMVSSAVSCRCRLSASRCKFCRFKRDMRIKTPSESKLGKRNVWIAPNDRKEKGVSAARVFPFEEGRARAGSSPRSNEQRSQRTIPKRTSQDRQQSPTEMSLTNPPPCHLHGNELTPVTTQDYLPYPVGSQQRHTKTPQEQMTRIQKKRLADYVKAKYSSKIYKFRKKEIHKPLTEKQMFFKCRYCRASFTSRVGRRIHEEEHGNNKCDPR